MSSVTLAPRPAEVQPKPATDAPAAPKPADRHRYRGDIDGLRAISILAVVVFHAGVPGFEGGYVGVDVFFVISGFLITGLLFREVSETGTISLGSFYSRRARRLLPLSATVIATTVLLGSMLTAPLGRTGLYQDAVAASVYLSNWRFAGEATTYSATEVDDQLLLHFWSLSIEEQFYFVWPFLILGVAALCRRFPTLRLRATLGLVLFAVTSASFLMSQSLTYRGAGAYYVTHARLWEMGVGAGLALVAHVLPTIGRRVATGLTGVGLLAIAFAVVNFDGRTAFPGTAALVPVLGCAAVIAGGLHSTGPLARWLAISPLRFIGRLSYAWYLWHWPIIGLAVLWSRRSNVDVPHGLIVFLAVVLSFGVSWITHVAIENPMRHLKMLQNQVQRNLRLALVLTAVPLLLGVGLPALVDTGETKISAPSGAVLADAVTAQEASTDRSPLARSCDKDDDAPVIMIQFCEIGDPNGSYRVLLIGDSHAQQWAPTLAAVAETESWSVQVSTKDACTPIDVATWNPVLVRSDIYCEQWRGEVKQLVAQMESVDLIVFGRAAFYRTRVVGEQGQALHGVELRLEWERGATQTLTDYKNLSDRVVLLTDLPWPGESPPMCLSAHPADPQQCEFERAGTIHDGSFLEAIAPAVAATGAEVVDATSMICSTPHCPVVAPSGRVIYRDSNHLTAAYARELAPELLAALAAP